MNRSGRRRRLDERLDAIGRHPRRKLLRALLDDDVSDGESRVLDVNDLANSGETSVVTMQHNHLPKLAGYGFITWDHDTGEVARGPDFAELRPLLEKVVVPQESPTGEAEGQ